MPSAAVLLADELVDALRAVEWSGVAFTVRRTYFDCEDEQLARDGGDVDVAVLVPDGYESVELDTRADIETRAVVTVVIRRKFGTADADDADGKIQEQQIDELILLAETLRDAAIAAGKNGLGGGLFDPPADHDPLYRRDLLRTMRQFVSVFSLTFAIPSEL